VIVRRSIVTNNIADDYGGGIAVTGSSLLLLQNSLILDNQGTDGGGVAVMDSARARVINTTFHMNATSLPGGDPGHGAGMFIASEGGVSSAEIVNSIFDDQNPGVPRTVAGENDIFDEAGRARVRYTMVHEFRFAGEGNSSDDPQLSETSRLSPGSPALDAGEACEAPRRDFERNERVDISTVLPDVTDSDLAPPDLGAFEYTGGGRRRSEDYFGLCCDDALDDGEGHEFRVCNYPRPFSAAQEICQTHGGHLATIASDREATSAGRALGEPDSIDSAWIGGYRFPDGDLTTWFWVDGDEWSPPGEAPFTEWRWSDGCPRDAFHEHCLDIQAATYESCNRSCSQELAFVCETEE